MISLAELRARKVAPVWQEAVAVVQELIQTVKATTGSAELLPDLEHVALIPNGDVVALPGSPAPETPVRHVAVMLKLLVDGVPAPPELEQFITRNVAQPPQYDTVAEFSRNLAFFERPGRRADVERLVARAIAAEQATRADEELQRLKARASEVTQVMAPPEFLQPPERKAQTVPIAAVAALGVVLIGAGLWLWTQLRGSQPPSAPAAVSQDAAAVSSGTPAEGSTASAAAPAPSTAAPGPATAATGATPAGAPAGAADPATPGPVASTPPGPAAAAPPAEKSYFARAADAVRSAWHSLWDTAPAPAPAPAPTPAADAKGAPATASAPGTAVPPGGAAAAPSPAATAARAPRPRRPRAATPAPAVAEATPAAPAPAPAPVPAAPAPSAPVYPPATIERALDTPVEVFTASDASVTPAVIVRPVLPKEPPPNVPPEQVGTIEVVVDERGDVLNVKLISPANRFHERMLVSAAKMWKFRPAYKDGRPVRYKAKVRLTI
jgi:hypothetical protein